MDRRVKERLVGATILVAIIVLVVPELLSGPKAPAPPPLVVDRAEPVRNVTVDLATSKATAAAPGTAAPAAVPDLSNAPASSAGTDSVSPGASSAADAGSLPGASAARDSSKVPDTWGAGDSATLPAGTSAGMDASAPDATAMRAAAPKDSPAAASSRSSGSPGSSSAAVAPPNITTLQPQRPATRAHDSAPSRPDTSVGAAPRAAAPARGAGHRVWFVQLGSFASKDHADNLVRQLKAQGIRVYVTAGGSGAALRYRVRTGALADRAAADKVITKLKAKGHDASVVAPAP